MTYLAEARAHLDKAREFLEAARDEHDFKRYSAAASSAVISGINSKDAICLKARRTTIKSDNHNQAVDELRMSGSDGASLASTIRRLLVLKSKSQYQGTPISAASARDAVAWAQRMYDVAATVVTRPD